MSSREVAEALLERAKEDILLYLEDKPETTLKQMIEDFYPTPGYGRDIFGWAFWNLVNDREIQYNNGQVAG